VLAGLVAGAGIGLVFAMVRLRGAIEWKIDLEKLRRMLRFSLPLVPASLALLLSTYASRFILNDLLTLTDVGLFTWASQLASIPGLMLVGVQGAVTPLVIKHHAEPGTPVLLARGLETVLAGGLWVCVALGLYTPELIRLLGYSQYAGAAPLVPILAPALLFVQVYVFAPGFMIAERTGLQLLISLLGAGAAVAFNYVFVAQGGAVGAAFATLVSSTLFIGSWFWISQRFYPVPVNWGRIALMVAAAAGCEAGGARLGGGSLVGTIVLKAIPLLLFGGVAALLGLARV